MTEEEAPPNWTVHGTAGGYTVWKESRGQYRINYGGEPEGLSGYRDLEAMLAQKNLVISSLVEAKDDAALVRAYTSMDQRYWTGHWLFEDRWRAVETTTRSGRTGAVRYTTPEEARNGALIRLAEARLGPSVSPTGLDADGLAVLRLIAAFPVEDMAHGPGGRAGRLPDYKLYGMNDWALTVGDVYAARRTLRGLGIEAGPLPDDPPAETAAPGPRI